MDEQKIESSTDLLKNLHPRLIHKIYVYTQRGSNLINSLFKGTCPKPVLIRPELYKVKANPATTTVPKTNAQASSPNKQETNAQQNVKNSKRVSEKKLEIPSTKKLKTDKKGKEEKINLLAMATIPYHLLVFSLQLKL